MSVERLILFTRYPVAGRVKTRLIPALGAEGAAALHRRLTVRALRAAGALKTSRDAAIEVHFDGATASAMQHWLGNRFRFIPQAEGDLGRRLVTAFEKSFQEGYRAVVIIGSDCPGLSAELLSEAFARLKQNRVVLGPAQDGGYYLIGLRQPVPQLFTGLAWGTESVFADSLRILEGLSLKPALLKPLADIDQPEDLSVWQRITEAEENDLRKISVIIPALNEGQRIAGTIAAAAAGRPHQILVVDGGSADRTVEEARKAGAELLPSLPGRAHQLNAGAVQASGNTLLFVHADTLLPEGYPAFVNECLSKPGIAAGAFRFALRESFGRKRFLEFTTNLRSRWLQMPYGDQGLFLRRSLFEELGGFADLPILEDYELVRRLRGRGQVLTAPAPALTSGRRWQRLGVFRATFINQWMLLGYHLGWPIDKLAASYRRFGARVGSPPPIKAASRRPELS